jgi:hypothetical protein
MITGKDLNYEIGNLSQVINNSDIPIVERAQLKALVLIIKLLQGIRANQVTDLKNQGINANIEANYVQVREE